MRVSICFAAVALCGCQSLTGLHGASTAFACKAPDGVACSSVSGVHANFMAGNLPYQRHGGAASALSTPTPTGLPLAMPVAGEPLRGEARILRIWLAPWVDDDDTLHDQSFLYAQVDPGRWQLGEIRRRIQAPSSRPDEASQRTSASTSGPASPPTTPANRPLAHVRADAQAQAAARAAVQASQRPQERPEGRP